MSKTATYSLIASNTLSSSAAQINFNSIPGTFTDLRMVISGVSNSNDNIFYRFNGSASTVYSRTDIVGSGTAALSVRASGLTLGRLTNYGWPDTNAGNQVTIWDIMDYSNTTTFTTSLARSNRATNGVEALVNLFSNTSAITSISIATNQFSGTQNWLSGTTVKLYGIQAGNA
jgi:hypothetical protein